MLNNYKCIVDTHCEVYDILKPWADDVFWDFSKHAVVQNAIYMIGREQFKLNVSCIKNIATENFAKIVLSNPAEGSETILSQIIGYGIEDLVKDKKILIICGGDLDSQFPSVKYESFMVKMLNYYKNVKAVRNCQEIYTKQNKPYKFLFLNGRNRWHRKILLSDLKSKNLLECALWTCLDQNLGPIQLLPTQYEVPKFQRSKINLKNNFVKHDLFKNTWGDVYVHLPMYTDTYFSLVTETVFRYPYSFRTEKIWKPIMIGHPWIAVANRGFYQDLKNLGFKTFSHLIDEKFDTIENDTDRLTAVSSVVESLCRSNLDEFMQEAAATCKYNQMHFKEAKTQEFNQFPKKLQNFIANNWPNA